MRPGEARCRTCNTSFELYDLILLCPCGSADIDVVTGRDMKILSMEVS
jgi:hydrogenase nickel incorporation protein HypA/HybF